MYRPKIHAIQKYYAIDTKCCFEKTQASCPDFLSGSCSAIFGGSEKRVVSHWPAFWNSWDFDICHEFRVDFLSWSGYRG